MDGFFAARMVKTFANVDRQVAKDCAVTLPEILVSLAHAFDCSFVCERGKDKGKFGSYNEGEWLFWDIAAGKRRVMAMIEEGLQESRDKTAGKAVTGGVGAA